MKKRLTISMAALLVGLIFFNGAIGSAQNETPMPQFSADEYNAHLRFLADDLLEGRSPGTPGCDVAAAYIAAQFRAIGLKPYSESTGYYQAVPLMRTAVKHDSTTFNINNGDRSIKLTAPGEAIVASELGDSKIVLKGDLFFVGYGIDAPEYGVDDFKGFDARDKILVMLQGLPESAKEKLPGKDRSLFGRTDFKLETARAKGARGVLFLLGKDQANSFESFKEELVGEVIRDDFKGANHLAVTGWIAGEASDKTLALAGSSYDELKAKADSPGFRSQKLELNISISMEQSVRRFTSPNVIGMLPGGSKKDEAVLFAAHYDGLGIGPPDEKGDRIYNGAADNAAGTSAMIALAKSFISQGRPPERTIVFLATTAEESGTLGGRYYTEHPAIPLNRTIVLLNVDGVNRYGLYDDFFALAVTATDEADTLNKIAEPLGMKMVLSQQFEEGMYYSFDTKPFYARGVPGFTIWQGMKMRGKTPQETFQYTKQFFGRHHRPSDEVTPDWNDEAAVQHLQLYYLIGRHYADGGARPSLRQNNPYTPLMKLRESKASVRQK